VIATCLVDTGSRMDDVIYEEFKGTATWNCTWIGGWPNGASSRHSTSSARASREELMLSSETLQRVWTLRRMIDMLRQTGEDPLEPVLERLRRTRNNKVFLETLSQSV
jgi:transcription termination factor Rho